MDGRRFRIRIEWSQGGQHRYHEFDVLADSPGFELSVLDVPLNGKVGESWAISDQTSADTNSTADADADPR